jgi:hypothetical protein
MMACSPYPSEEALEDDIEYFLKKMGWSRSQLSTYLERPEVPHDRYASEWNLSKRINRVSALVKTARSRVLGA